MYVGTRWVLEANKLVIVEILFMVFKILTFSIFQLFWFSWAMVLGHICHTVESVSVLFQVVVPWLPECSEAVSCRVEPEVCTLCIRLPLYTLDVVHEWAEEDRENDIFHSNRLWNTNLAWEKPQRLKTCKKHGSSSSKNYFIFKKIFYIISEEIVIRYMVTD